MAVPGAARALPARRSVLARVRSFILGRQESDQWKTERREEEMTVVFEQLKR
jgi:hypothetical protein